MMNRLLKSAAAAAAVVLIGAGCASVPEGTAYDPRAGSVRPAGHEWLPGETFSVMAWNLEHFVDQYDNPYVNSGRENEPDGDLTRRYELLAEALAAIDADVVAFQEVESEEFMMALAEEYWPELGYAYFRGTRSPTWYQNTVVMSRAPLGVMRDFGGVHTPSLTPDMEPTTQDYINRRIAAVDVLVDGDYAFTMFTAHLKAGTSERDHFMRAAQYDLIEAQMALILAADDDANLLLAGDLNSAPGYAEFDAFLEEDGEREFIDPLAGTDVFTHPSDDPRRRIDHVLPNDEMADELVEGSARVPAFDAEKLRAISDHLPIIAEFYAEERED